ncbi:NmrA family transcriptional regulator [Aspergillus novofumigatus IBT 16806]|uniref:NmrA family transcriptional regulator n=1 Tax=Aspergillus novofumigatus (strain IBT 16806) TaxID=1392255 RepID=A0A2I1BU04_ASPN1|nr:NmrA family transcriptional regulator [Aspergillus novofumigatus IBT 16806]PKX88875.1 NmrA family transcriptional regulator [Aspergillus novofumigatus IBT 16806]
MTTTPAGKKVLVVFGATGQQGGSLIRYVLKDSLLSAPYHIRPVTRNPSHRPASNLKTDGVEVFQADADDPASLRRVMRGASMTFAMTLLRPQNHPGKAIADAAVVEGLDPIIFSTLPHVTKISGGRYQKSRGGRLRGLPIRSIFYCPVWFMQNFNQHIAPREMADGTLDIINIVSAETKLPLIDSYGHSGKFIAPVLAEPEKNTGQTLSAAEHFYSYQNIAKEMSKKWGKSIDYRLVLMKAFASKVGRVFGQRLIEMMLYFEEYGHYGPQGEEMIVQTAQTASDNLTNLEEYLGRNPL